MKQGDPFLRQPTRKSRRLPFALLNTMAAHRIVSDAAAAKPAHEKSASAKKAAATRAKNMGPRDDIKPATTNQPQVGPGTHRRC